MAITSVEASLYKSLASTCISIALSRGLSTTKPAIEVPVLLDDPITGTQKTQYVVVAFTRPSSTTSGIVWLDANKSSSTFTQFFVYASNAWFLVPPGSLLYSPAQYVVTTPSNKAVDATTTRPSSITTVNLTATDNKFQYFNQTLTSNTVVNLPSTGLADALEFQIVRYAATPGNFTLTINDPVTSKSHVIAANAKGFSHWRANGTTEWVPTAQGTLA